MTAEMERSRIFQKIGLDMYLEAERAPKPMKLNQMTLAVDAPKAKIHFWSSNWLARLPRKITVSRYTCGLMKVKARTLVMTLVREGDCDTPGSKL